ncbi:putative acetyltransferase [Rhizobium sp. PP-F2F-G48]|uniref:acetyltransferase n=1 Tax=Rhizobium sp. PP-F2F-G48 TaxID=2135651 RepID=UPI0010529614|nr:acetyltransferase [Rhizobium sp. PP-F2F-G48]TCM55043.1 putative acetyltransferase [Rhizobium sp. PP-F2F-G48]
MPCPNDPWRLRHVATQDRQRLRALLDDYLQELSAFGPVDTAYRYFDLYFEDADRSAYMIDVVDAGAWTPAGFALVNRHACSGLPVDHAMAEFCVLPDVRRTGLGHRAAGRILALHPGVWELGVSQFNAAAWSFWCRVTERFPNVETISAGERRILRFESPDGERRIACEEG